MINILYFEWNHEMNWARSVASKSLIEIWKLTNEPMFIHRYKLINEDIFRGKKVQITNSNKIDFKKLTGKNLIIYHLDIWKNNPLGIKDLYNWSKTAGVDIWIYIPLIFTGDHIREISSFLAPLILEGEALLFDLTGVDSHELNNKVINIIRDWKIKKLLMKNNI